ncbi:MAG TPA: Pycsar system effector family protein, partial [Vicinamibacteria bacterium]|nr:Pycsar system effector family protein [Vicinamibacteria bacterium]
HAFHTIAPRFPKAPPSLAFYGDIAKLSREEYVEKVKSLSTEEALDQMINYNHTVSAICVEKFRQLRMGMKAFKAAFPLWALLMSLVVMDEVAYGKRD